MTYLRPCCESVAEQGAGRVGVWLRGRNMVPAGWGGADGFFAPCRSVLA